jgi:hypothetical protein
MEQAGFFFSSGADDDDVPTFFVQVRWVPAVGVRELWHELVEFVREWLRESTSQATKRGS